MDERRGDGQTAIGRPAADDRGETVRHRRGGIAHIGASPDRRALPGRLRSLMVLLLILTLLAPGAAMATMGQDTPEPAPSPRPGEVTTDQLLATTLDWQHLPTAVDTIALARVALPPERAATAVSGAHLFIVEAGALTLQEFARAYLPPTGTPGPVHEDVAAGPVVTYDAGATFVVTSRGGSPPAIISTGSEPAIALVVSIAAIGSSRIDSALTGWSIVESLIIDTAARVGPFLVEAGRLGAEPISVSLVRATYDRGASFDFIWVDRAARLLAVESGALNFLTIDPALHRPAGASPRQLGSTARISMTPGDQLLVFSPGRIATQNVGRGPSAALILTVGSTSL